MPILDAHQHFWQYDPERHGWIDNRMAVLRKDFLPGDLKPIYLQNGVEGCIAVQAEQSEEETEFLLSLAEEHDIIKGVVGWVDLRSENVEERLAHFAGRPKLCGFRHIVQDEPNVKFMLRDDFRNGLSLLAKHNFTYDLLIYPKQLETTLQTVMDFPDQKFVIDHLAKPDFKSGNISFWEKNMQAIAENPNVYCKISGLITEADWRDWNYKSFVPFLKVVFEAFGTDRLMFGSDWPVCLLAGSFGNVKGIVEYFLEDFSEEEKEKVWGGNAKLFYGL